MASGQESTYTISMSTTSTASSHLNSRQSSDARHIDATASSSDSRANCFADERPQWTGVYWTKASDRVEPVLTKQTTPVLALGQKPVFLAYACVHVLHTDTQPVVKSACIAPRVILKVPVYAHAVSLQISITLSNKCA